MGADGIPQYIYYDSGVGTQVGERITGGMFGIGIDENVRKAYEWLIENYEDNDDIFIFGFSRGAFTARSLAGMLSICGLAKPGAPLGVGQLYTRYRHVRIPIQSGHRFRFHSGHHSDLKPATVPR